MGDGLIYEGKPLGLWTVEEIDALAQEEPLQPTGGRYPVNGPLRMLAEEMRALNARHVADLGPEAVVTHAVMLGLLTPEEGVMLRPKPE